VVTHRAERIADQIRGALSDILRRKMRDPRIALAGITAVTMSPDLRHARVYVSVLGDAHQREEAVNGLTHAAGFLRRELGRAVRMKYIPRLVFLPDLAGERAGRIDEALAHLDLGAGTDAGDPDDGDDAGG
jgi:ribosome-binding factor A